MPHIMYIHLGEGCSPEVESISQICTYFLNYGNVMKRGNIYFCFEVVHASPNNDCLRTY